PTRVSPRPLHDALPPHRPPRLGPVEARDPQGDAEPAEPADGGGEPGRDLLVAAEVAAEADDYSFAMRSTASAKRSLDAHKVTLTDRKSTRLNSSHVKIS